VPNVSSLRLARHIRAFASFRRRLDPHGKHDDAIQWHEENVKPSLVSKPGVRRAYGNAADVPRDSSFVVL
jgi:hypothetical protein